MFVYITVTLTICQILPLNVSLLPVRDDAVTDVWMTTYLLSKWIDPCLGVFTGCLAYYLSETHPRTVAARPPGQTLKELVQWKLSQRETPMSEEVS